MAFSVPPWFGNHVTNQATARWLGRNRPATGGGAVRDAGAAPAGQPHSLGEVAGQRGDETLVSARSVNPHTASLNGTFASEGDHAPENAFFKGTHLAPISAFHPGQGFAPLGINKPPNQ